jgi:hypothetical protein
MLYLLRADGREEQVVLATDAYIDPLTNQLICVNGDGTVIRRYGPLKISAFSKKRMTTVVPQSGRPMPYRRTYE